MLQKTDVIAHLMGGGGDPRQHVGHSGVHLSGIGLAGNGETFLKAHLCGYHRIYLVDGLLIPVEKLQKRRLRARGSFGSQQLHAPEDIVHILQVHKEFLNPEGSPLSHRGGLGRLEMGEGQRGLGLVLVCKIRQHPDHVHQLLLHQTQGLGHDDNVRIIPHVAGGGSQMDDPRRLGALLPIGVHMAHDVMANLLLSGFGHLIIDVLRVGLKLLNLLLRDHGLSVLA